MERFPTRRAFAECVIDAFRQTGSGVLQWVCCRERHRHNGQHYHMAVKLKRIRRLIFAKQYLKDRCGITVNFSNSHDNYYSAWKYVTKEDEEVLQSAGHSHLWNLKPPRTQGEVKREQATVDLDNHKIKLRDQRVKQTLQNLW